MSGVMSGIPMSAFSWVLIYALMWVPVIVIFIVLFSVGSGLGPNEEATVHPISTKPAPKQEPQPVRHAA